MKLKNLSSVILAAMMAATSVPCAGLVPYSNMNTYAVEAEANEIVAEGVCGEKLTWTLYDDGYIYIDGEGAMDNWASADDVPWAEYRDQIKRIRAPKEVKNVGDYAFYDCVNLEYAFCATIIGEHAYENCKNITNYYLYEEPIEIKDYAFYGCDKLNRVSIHNSSCVIADSPYVFPENASIRGVAGSTAEAYAEKYGKEFVEIGNEESGEQAVVAEGKCGENLTWKIYDFDKLLVISGEGTMTNWESFDATPWAEYSDYIQAARIENGVANIGENAFSALKNEYFDNGCYGRFDIENPDCIIADSPYVFPESVAIGGIAGSTAQAYAEKYNREFEEIREPDSGVQAVVAEGTCGETLDWNIQSDKRLVIKGNGVMDSYEGYSNWEEYTELFDTVEYSGELENYGEYAFYNCKNLKEFEIAPVIGAHAFEGCSNISGVKVPKGFVLNEIGDYAFYGCDNLGMFIIGNPECVIADSPYVFPEDMVIYGVAGSTAQAYAEKYNREFKEIREPYSGEQEVIAQGTLFEKFPYKLTSMGEFIIEGEGKLEGLTRWSIAFENSEKVTRVTLSEDITAIGAYNFFNCNNLGSMYIGKNVESIGDYAFYGCYKADYINIENPDCVIADSPYVFPKDMVIGGYAGSTAEAYAKKYNREFYAFPEEVANGKLSESVTWRLNSDGGLYIEGEGDIPDCDGVNIWGEYADSIRYFQIIGNIGKIGDYAFYNCKNLYDANVEVKIIGEHAFDGCEKLEYIYSFEEAIEIKDYAFYGCDSLEKANILVENCIIADSPNVFPENTTIEGVCDSLKAYAEKYNFNYEDCTLATEGKLDENYTWYLSNNGVLNLSGEGNMRNGIRTNLWGEYSDKIEYAFFDIKSGSIGEYAFYNCKNLEEVGYVVGAYDSLKIGSHAFEGCEKLTSFGAFENVIRIGNYAFNGCDSLEYVSIFNPGCAIADSEFVFPENTVIYGYTGSTAEAYAKKYNRTFESWGEFEDKFIGEGKLSETIEYTLTGDGVLTISGEGKLSDEINDNIGGFWGSLADKINTIELSDDITEIGDNMFAGCENLKYIFTNANVIGEHAFEGCTSLLPVTLKEADKIGDYAFYNTDVSRVVIFNPECEIADSPYVFSEDTIIYGYENSTAEKYARKYERMFLAIQTFLLGDVNDDGKIDSADASAVLAEYAASQTGGELTLFIDAADVNDDGLVNSSDASAILEYYAKASIGEEPSWNLTDVTK